MKPEERRPQTQKKSGLLPAIIDPMEYSKNLCSEKARIVITESYGMDVELWYDKHYIDRHQLGDDNGKRQGIDIDVVKNLVLDSIQHLFFYAAKIKNFTFINHNLKRDFGRAIRVVCQEEITHGMLNVPIEVHAKSLTTFEVTVITAMNTDEFKISDGQYAILLYGVNNSILRFKSRGKLEDIDSI